MNLLKTAVHEAFFHSAGNTPRRLALGTTLRDSPTNMGEISFLPASIGSATLYMLVLRRPDFGKSHPIFPGLLVRPESEFSVSCLVSKK